MRVGIVTTSFPLTRRSSSGPFILRLVNSLPANIEAVVVTPCTSTRVIDSPLEKRHKLICFRYAPVRLQLLAHQPGGVPVAFGKHPWLILLLPFFLSSMFLCYLKLGKNVDVIHANWSVNGAIAGIAGVLSKTGVVTTLRGTDLARARRSWSDRLLLALCMKLSSKVVTVSEALAEEAKELLPDEEPKLVTIPNGVPKDLLCCKKRPLHQGALNVVTVCNLIPLKGVDVVIEAMTYVSSSSSLKLKIAGDGPQRRYLERLVCEHGLEQRVLFLGVVSPDDVLKLLTNADAFVLASCSEGRPNALLEAMAAAVPIVASDIAGIREIIEHELNGLLFAPGDAQSLANSLDRISQDYLLRRRIGESGRNYIVSKKLTWENTARKYAELYRNVAASTCKTVA